MAASVDIRIDAQRHSRLAPLRRGERRNAIELAGRFGVDRADADGDRALQLGARLADSGEHDVGRVHTRAQGDRDLTAGVRVECAADRPEQANDSERRIRLQCVMNAVRMRRERLIDGAIAVANGSSAVDVDGRIDALDDRFEAYAVAHETRIGVRERLVHERRHVIMRALMAHRARVRVAPAMPAARA